MKRACDALGESKMSYTVGKYRPPKRTRWKPGQSGNPQGARRHDQGLKRSKRLLNPEVQQIISDVLMGTVGELTEVLNDFETPVLKLMVARIVERAILTANMRVADSLIDRVIGRPKECVGGIVLNPFYYLSQKEMDRLYSDPECSAALQKLKEKLGKIRSK
jgi:hypothetical protein